MKTALRRSILSGWSEGIGGGEIQVFVTDNSGTDAGGWLEGWFDLDGDGVRFDIAISQAVYRVRRTLCLTFPCRIPCPRRDSGYLCTLRLFATTTDLLPITLELSRMVKSKITSGASRQRLCHYVSSASTDAVNVSAYMFIAVLLTAATALITLRQRRLERWLSRYQASAGCGGSAEDGILIKWVGSFHQPTFALGRTTADCPSDTLSSVTVWRVLLQILCRPLRERHLVFVITTS